MEGIVRRWFVLQGWHDFLHESSLFHQLLVFEIQEINLHAGLLVRFAFLYFSQRMSLQISVCQRCTCHFPEREAIVVCGSRGGEGDVTFQSPIASCCSHSVLIPSSRQCRLCAGNPRYLSFICFSASLGIC